MNAIVAAKKSDLKEIVWNARGVVLKRPTGSQAIDILIKIAEYVQRNSIAPDLSFNPGVDGVLELLRPCHSPYTKYSIIDTE